MTDLQIITAIRQGQEDAIRHVMHKYSRLLWDVAATILKNVGTAEDVEECVADVFVRLWEAPSRFDPARGTLRSWLAIMARSRAVDRYRQLSRQAAAPLDENSADRTDLVEGVLSRQAKRALLCAVDSLSEPDREILLRRYFYEQKPREIAFALQMPVKQVQNHLYRTKLRLREQLTEEGDYR